MKEYLSQKLSAPLTLTNTTGGGSMGMMKWESINVRKITQDDGTIEFTAYLIVGKKCYCSTKTFLNGSLIPNVGCENSSEEILNDKLYNKYK